MKKTLILVGTVVIIFVVIAVIFGSVFTWHNKLVLKTYTNDNAGFQIKYLYDWTYYTYTDNSFSPPVNFPVFYKINKNNSGCSLHVFSIKTEGLTAADTYSQEEMKLGGIIDSSNFNDFVKDVAFSIGFPPGFTHKIEDTTINGIPAKKFNTNPYGEDAEYDVFTPNYIFVIDEGFNLPMGTVAKQSPLSDSEKRECKNNFDLMLSTFKIKTSETSQTVSQPATQNNNLCSYFSGDKGVTTNAFNTIAPWNDEDALLPLTCHFSIGSNVNYTFKFSKTANSQYNQNIYYISIFDSSNKLVQTINTDGVNNFYYNLISLKDDINFDGYKDLAVLDSPGGTNPDVYDYYTFNPSSEMFDQDTDLQGLFNPVFDSTKKQITTMDAFGAGVSQIQTIIFTFINGKYVQTSTSGGD